MSTTLNPYRPVKMPPGQAVTPGPTSGGGVDPSPRSVAPSSADGHGQTSGTRTFFTLVEPGVNSAISRGLFRQVRFLAQFGADVNERDAEGRTPLVHCALVDSDPWAVGLARVLVEKGASVGLRDRNGLNALHYAAIYNKPGLLDVFLGAVDFNLNQVDKLGNTALHYAVSVGNVAVVEKVVKALQRYDLPLDVVNKKGVTPLMQAYKCANADCAAILVSHGGGGGLEGNPSAEHLVECRTALETRNARLVQLENSAHAAASRSNTSSVSGVSARVRVVVTSPRSTTTSGQQRTASQRPISARVTAITQRLTSGHRRSARRRRGDGSGEEDVEKDPEKEILNQPKNLDRIYRAASATELRNRPEVVFNMNPIECLLQGTSSHPQMPRRPPSVATNRKPPPGRAPASWRCEMKRLYGAFEFQFTPSFVAGVKPLPPEPEPISEDSSSLRPSSALATESMSGSMSDVASICSKRSVSRRTSSVSTIDSGGKARRGMPSLVGNKKRQLQALLTLRGDSDTSSTDTASSGSSRRRKEDSEGSATPTTKKSGKTRLGALMEPLVAVKGKSGIQTS